MTTQTISPNPGIFKSEMALWLGIITAVIFFTYGYVLMADLSNTLVFSLLFGWLFAVMLWLSFGVVRHAD